MKPACIYASYVISLLWVALLMAIAIGIAEIVELVFVDFVHGNPHRTQANAIEMMLLFAPIAGFIAFFVTSLVFAVPQGLQATLTDVLLRRLNRRGLFGVLLALPLTAAVAWYCYDYLIPKNFNLGINLDQDWTPYQHGLTLQRYLIMVAIQTPITLFSVLYCDATICNRSKKWIIVGAFLFAVLVGVFYGHWMAEAQYRFL